MVSHVWCVYLNDDAGQVESFSRPALSTRRMPSSQVCLGAYASLTLARSQGQPEVFRDSSQRRQRQVISVLWPVTLY